MISKLEGLLEKTLKDTQKARDGMLELEKLRTENLELQNALQRGGAAMPKKGGAYDPNAYEAEENDRLRKEISLLESLVSELRAELKNKRPQTANGN